MYSAVSVAFIIVDVPLVMADIIVCELGIGVEARRCTWAKKMRAMETLFVACVEGNPYSKWCDPIAYE